MDLFYHWYLTDRNPDYVIFTEKEGHRHLKFDTERETTRNGGSGSTIYKVFGNTFRMVHSLDTTLEVLDVGSFPVFFHQPLKMYHHFVFDRIVPGIGWDLSVLFNGLPPLRVLLGTILSGLLRSH